MISSALLEQAAAYALGAMDANEVGEFEDELERSEELRREVADLRRVSGFVAMAASPRSPPPRLRERILAEARRVRPIESVRRDVAEPGATARVTAPRPPRWTVMVPWLALAAALAGVVVMRGRYLDERDARLALALQSDSMRTSLASSDSIIAALLAPDVETAKLVSSGRSPSARIYWNRSRNRVILAVFSLPPAPTGRTYQLWGIAGPNAAPVSLGVFNTSASGEGRLAAAVPEGLTIAVGAVTEEPEGGSPQPTTQPFLVGQMR